MVIDIRTVTTVSLIVQLVLIAFVFGAVYLARKRGLIRHCTIISGATIVQIVTIVAIMPSMLGYVKNVPPEPRLNSVRFM